MKHSKQILAGPMIVLGVAAGLFVAGSPRAEGRFDLAGIIETNTAPRGGQYAMESSEVALEGRVTGGVYSMSGDVRRGVAPMTEASPFSSDVSSIRLGPCRPNPFWGDASVAFSVTRSQHVELSVYDLRGAIVRTLVQGTVAPGRHSVSWDGRNASGERVAKGVYLVRLTAPDFHASAKAVFLGTP